MNGPTRPAGWTARLELAYDYDGRRTRLCHRRHEGPLRVQRPLYPEGAVNHTLLLHPPAGLVGGDRLSLDVRVAAGAHVLQTTPGAMPVYRSIAGPARVDYRFAVDGTLEWLPQQTLLFDGCDLHSRIQGELGPAGRLLLLDINCLGRPASAAPFDTGYADLDLRLDRGGIALFRDRLRLQADGALRQRPWGLAGSVACGTLLAYPAPAELLPPLQRRLGEHQEGRLSAGATRLDELLVVRGLADDGTALMGLLRELWLWLRPQVLDTPGRMPRIWST